MEDRVAKKYKREEGKRLAKVRKNQHEICPNSNRKKYNLGHNYKYSQNMYNTQVDSNKCLRKRDIAKTKRIVEHKRLAEKRKKLT